MADDKQRLEALEKYVSVQASNATGFVAGVLIWSIWIPIGPVMWGASIVFLAASVWNYYDYMKAKYQ